MFFPGPISNNRQDFGGDACPLFAGELLGKRWPSGSFGLGHIARDVAFLGIVRFTAVPGAGRAPEVGGSREGASYTGPNGSPVVEAPAQ